jgi:hypothetical protein
VHTMVVRSMWPISSVFRNRFRTVRTRSHQDQVSVLSHYGTCDVCGAPRQVMGIEAEREISLELTCTANVNHVCYLPTKRQR